MSTVHQNKISDRLLISALLAAIFLGGCSVGPNYHRPTVTTPSSFKELIGLEAGRAVRHACQGRMVAGVRRSPARHARRPGRCFEPDHRGRGSAIPAGKGTGQIRARRLFSDRISAGPSSRAEGVTECRNPRQTYPLAAATPPPFTDNLLQGDVAWEPDIWGRVRRTVESSRASAQASAADLAAVCLSTQAELAQDYFALRIADIQERLFDSSVAIYSKFFDLTQLRDEQGIASQADVLTAQTQLASAQAQLIDIGVQRSQLEHAVATLIGEPASFFAIDPVDTLPMRIVAVPPALPSTLLERRPDVAAAERTVAAANAQIGVAKAAYYPNLTLSGTGGYESSDFSNLLSWPSRMWSLGGALAENLFTGGPAHRAGGSGQGGV